MSHEERLKELNIGLPDAPSPLGSYVPCVQTGNLIFVSGMLPLKDGKLLYAGRVGDEVSKEDPSVINAASELLFEIFGDKGRHARAAVGVYTLPMNSPVEIDFIFELES
jgi:enamine deaminase RidA (YjgF/YER057c/UK114 family)